MYDLDNDSVFLFYQYIGWIGSTEFLNIFLEQSDAHKRASGLKIRTVRLIEEKLNYVLVKKCFGFV